MDRLPCYDQGGECPEAERRNKMEYLLEATNRELEETRAELKLYQDSYPRPVRLQADFAAAAIGSWALRLEHVRDDRVIN